MKSAVFVLALAISFCETLFANQLLKCDASGFENESHLQFLCGENDCEVAYNGYGVRQEFYPGLALYLESSGLTKLLGAYDAGTGGYANKLFAVFALEDCNISSFESSGSCSHATDRWNGIGGNFIVEQNAQDGVNLTNGHATNIKFYEFIRSSLLKFSYAPDRFGGLTRYSFEITQSQVRNPQKWEIPFVKCFASETSATSIVPSEVRAAFNRRSK